MKQRLSNIDMTNKLMAIYDSRLKSLIGYTNSAFTREIIEYMFQHFEYINEHTEHGGYGHTLPQYFSDILSFQPGSGSKSGDSASFSADRLTLNLENYIHRNVELLYPNWQEMYKNREEKYKDYEYRRVMPNELQKEINDNRARYPFNLNFHNLFSQLNYTTMQRNRLAHNSRFANTYDYRRHYILMAYDTILAYLLYTFYYMCLNKDYELKHIKE